MSSAAPIKIYPTMEECQIKTNITCPIEESCTQVFKSETNLNLHISKKHKITTSKITAEKWYFCPEFDCPWNGNKHFKQLKNLRQHVLKKHTVHMFSCKTCTKTFPSDKKLQNHVDFCNVDFRCLDCKQFYGSYETLQTHCRRRNHNLLKKHEYKADNGDKMPTKVSTETQTSTNSGKQSLSVETQTISPKSNLEDNLRNNNTQTDSIESTESSCNTSFDMNSSHFTFTDYIETINSSTQTPTPSPLISGFDSNLFSSQTQTDFVFEDEMFNSDFYSNNYTQTCDGFLNTLNSFSDIETQTAFDQQSRSVESQTLMSATAAGIENLLKDISHTETQTDEQWREMLELINS